MLSFGDGKGQSTEENSEVDQLEPVIARGRKEGMFG
jgi:hypothetical protein